MVNRFMRGTSREIHYFAKRLSNRKIESQNTGNISNIRMLKPPDVMSIKNHQTKIFAAGCRERAISILSEILFNTLQFCEVGE